MRVKVEAKNGFAEGFPLPMCVPVDHVALGVMGDAFEHVFGCAAATREGDEAVPGAVQRPGPDVGGDDALDERLVIRAPGVVALLGALARIRSDEIVGSRPAAGVSFE